MCSKHIPFLLSNPDIRFGLKRDKNIKVNEFILIIN